MAQGLSRIPAGGRPGISSRADGIDQVGHVFLIGPGTLQSRIA
jgi:hypothetical protein